ncbi:MAG: glycosyltransferase family 2 protein [Ignavibacteriaceae bacterium]|jgi:rhamnosyltransferase
MLRTAGATILYNPNEEVITNILTYLDQIELLYIVDNSETIGLIPNKLKDYSKIKFVDNFGNIGIAAALNKAANQAIEDNYDILLTMDQDSRVSENLVEEMIKQFERNDKIGILSPFVIHKNNPLRPPTQELESITVAITSGCTIRLSMYKEIGGFDEKLFIDYVDIDYSLRMLSRGYKIFQLNNTSIYHKLGDIKKRKFLFKIFFPTNHPPVRIYYRTRNRFWVYKRYKELFPEFIKQDKRNFLKELVKILLFEKEKLNKYYMVLLGYRHCRKNRFGKFN